MSKIILPQLISCDESGFTGNRLLDVQQPYFAYGSTDLSDVDAAEIIENIRLKYQLYPGELKCSKLLKSNRGRKAVFDLLGQMRGRYISTLYNKKLCLGAKVFEYIYEPVLKRNSLIFYENNLHRFVAMFIYTLIQSGAKGINLFVEEFEKFMRSLNPADAPILFGDGALDDFDVMLHPIINFARGYNVSIAQETRSLEETGDTGKWVLDLTLSAVTDHLRKWGDKHEIINVNCDDSKPLRALAGVYDVMINRPETTQLNIFGKQHRVTWNMSRSIEFVDSKDYPAVQLADIIAGVTAALGKISNRDNLKTHGMEIMEHLSQDYSIMPDTDYADPNIHQSRINQAVLIELERRAKSNMSALIGMDAFYDHARRTLP